jgi:hypothetical protein
MHLSTVSGTPVDGQFCRSEFTNHMILKIRSELLGPKTKERMYGYRSLPLGPAWKIMAEVYLYLLATC